MNTGLYAVITLSFHKCLTQQCVVVIWMQFKCNFCENETPIYASMILILIFCSYLAFISFEEFVVMIF